MARGFCCSIAFAVLALLGPACLNAGSPAGATVVHVVFVWLKEPGNSLHRERIIDASRKFSDIPGVLEVRVGEPIESDRDIVDDSFDIGLYMTFATPEALQRYLVDETHQAAVQEILRPLSARLLVYDFEDEGT